MRIISLRTYMDDGRKALKEVMKVDTSRLTQPPKPKPSTLVTIDSDDEETSMPRTKPAQEDVVGIWIAFIDFFI